MGVIAGSYAPGIRNSASAPSAWPVLWRQARRALLHFHPFVWAYIDVMLIAAVTFCAYNLMLRGNPAYQWVAGPWASALTFCASFPFAGLIFGLYEQQTLASRVRILVRGLSTLGVGLVLSYAVLTLFFYLDTTRWLGLVVASAYLIIAIPLRLIAHEAITHERLNVLFLGRGRIVGELAQMIRGGHRPHYHIIGYVDPHDESPDPTAVCCPRLGRVSDIEQIVRSYQVDEVIVESGLPARDHVDEAILQCLNHPCRVTDRATFVEKFLGQVPTADITAQWFLIADLRATGSYDAIKRAMDLLASAIGLMLAAPLWPLIAVAIKLDSRGPAIYKQIRTGLNGRDFEMLKFRTMRTDAETNGAQWATPNDARVTRIGKILRRSRLDELPQLWNILRGEMSLVGPRPERPEFIERLAEQIPHYRQRHLIKPGLSGWAQIHYGYGASVDDTRRKLCYDLYYLKHRSIDLDAAIVIRTLGRFVFGSR